MPRKVEWMERLGELRATLEAFPAPVLDRACLEKLFGVSRRQAIRLALRFGGYQSGRTFLLERTSLLRQIDAFLDSPDYRQEISRREKLHATLERSRLDQRARAVPITPLPLLPALARVKITPGHLHLEFDHTEELLGQLLSLVQEISADIDAFREKADRPLPREPLLI